VDNVAAIDMFCGVGGLTRGLLNKGIPVVAGVDIDKVCAYPYEKNNSAKFICGSVTDISGAELTPYYENADIKILVGCAPCQTFSKHTQKNRDRQKDEKWTLLSAFLDRITEVSPHIVSMENVAELVKYEIFDNFVQGLEKLGFHVSHSIVNTSDYGVPQSRKRLVLLASNLGPITLSSGTVVNKIVTVRDTIGQLASQESGEVSQFDQLHRSSKLSDLNHQRIKQSVPGGTWRDLDKSLVLECHKKDTGKSYTSVYGRMQWDSLAPTITTQFFIYGTGRFGHPEQNRALTLREGAMLQTFPKNYEFVEPGQEVYLRSVGRMIGNAVPVKLGELVGQSILDHLQEHGISE